MSSDTELAEGAQIGPYRVSARLGSGGMGVVWRAEHAVLQRPVALKVLKSELAADRQYLDRFLREARAAALVNHQNVVAIHDAGEVEGRPWLACEFVPGGDLDQTLAKKGSLPPEQALRLIAECADGLQALHEAGLVHRDIKPHNIFLDAQGRAKLGDFGLARDAGGADRMTVTGVGMGTPAYMAPEQAQGAADLDIRSDIHALGGTLFSLLTGKPPYDGATPWAVVNAVMNDAPPDPRSICKTLPAEVAAIVLRALAKRREDRFQTPAELAAACRAVLAGLRGGTGVVLPQWSAPSLWGPLSGRGWCWPAAAATVLLLLPLGLEPLAALHPDAKALGYNTPGLWGRWLAWSVVATAFVWVPLRLRRGERPGRAGLSLPLLLSALGLGLGWLAAFRSVLVACDAAPGWLAVAGISACLLTLGWIAWWAKAWWGRDAAGVPGQLTRLFQALAPLLVVVVAMHLLAADSARNDPNGGLASRIFGRRDSESPSAAALLAIAHLALAALPALILVRRRRA